MLIPARSSTTILDTNGPLGDVVRALELKQQRTGYGREREGARDAEDRDELLRAAAVGG